MRPPANVLQVKSFQFSRLLHIQKLHSGTFKPCAIYYNTRQYHVTYSVSSWWLVRVTLVVPFGFLLQNFGCVVGTYKSHLPFCECRSGGGSTWRWGLKVGGDSKT